MPMTYAQESGSTVWYTRKLMPTRLTLIATNAILVTTKPNPSLSKNTTCFFKFENKIYLIVKTESLVYQSPTDGENLHRFSQLVSSSLVG